MLYLFKIDITTPMTVSICIFVILLLTQALNSGHGNQYHNYILLSCFCQLLYERYCFVCCIWHCEILIDIIYVFLL